MTRYIGFRWKLCEERSREVLIKRQCNHFFLLWIGNARAFVYDCPRSSRIKNADCTILVAFARGKHLFPSRTEPLSLSAPMVPPHQLQQQGFAFLEISGIVEKLVRGESRPPPKLCNEHPGPKATHVAFCVDHFPSVCRFAPLSL